MKIGENQTELEGFDESVFLRFYLGTDLYAVKLMDVQEVIEFTAPKKIPNTHDYFQGVINVRGEIVGVIDLREKLHYEKSENNRPVLILLKHGDTCIASLVDQLLDVKKITSWDEKVIKNIEARVDQEYLLGVHLDNDSFVIGIDLKKILTNEDVQNLASSKLQKVA